MTVKVQRIDASGEYTGQMTFIPAKEAGLSNVVFTDHEGRRGMLFPVVNPAGLTIHMFIAGLTEEIFASMFGAPDVAIAEVPTVADLASARAATTAALQAAAREMAAMEEPPAAPEIASTPVDKPKATRTPRKRPTAAEKLAATPLGVVPGQEVTSAADSVTAPKRKPGRPKKEAVRPEAAPTSHPGVIPASIPLSPMKGPRSLGDITEAAEKAQTPGQIPFSG